MKQPIITASLVALGIMIATPAMADSAMQERFREEGKQLDLTGFLQSDTDARSRSFLFGGTHEHDFTVKETGVYLLESEVPGGRSEDYRIAGELLNAQGDVLARSEALGQNDGLAMRQRLTPGDYTLRVEAHRFGTRSDAMDSFYYITVSGLDKQGRPKTDAVDRGEGLVFTGKGRESSRSVFVRGSETVATISAPSVASDTAGSNPATSAADSAQPQTSSETSAAAAQQETSVSPREGFETIVTDVKIRAKGEVLTFEVAKPGTIAITTSTYPGGYEDTYRIELDVLDESGNVVAEGAGEGFDGDVDLQTRLSPGRYRIRVKGQKFGSAHSGVNNYELKVEQLNRR
ncbi:hypothetical protein LG290_11615 [Halomonas sediminis]